MMSLKDDMDWPAGVFEPLEQTLWQGCVCAEEYDPSHCTHMEPVGGPFAISADANVGFVIEPQPTAMRPHPLPLSPDGADRLFSFRDPIGPLQSPGHIVKDHKDKFLCIECRDQEYVAHVFGEGASRGGFRIISTYLCDGEHMEEIPALTGTYKIMVPMCESSVVLKPKLPNLGAKSQTLSLYVETSLMWNNQVHSLHGEKFPFQRFTHLNKLPLEDVKRSGKKTRSTSFKEEFSEDEDFTLNKRRRR